MRRKIEISRTLIDKIRLTHTTLKRKDQYYLKNNGTLKRLSYLTYNINEGLSNYRNGREFLAENRIIDSGEPLKTTRSNEVCVLCDEMSLEVESREPRSVYQHKLGQLWADKKAVIGTP